MTGQPNTACTHKQAVHLHGTRTCYVVDRCRCAPCTEANRADTAQRRRAQLYGRYDALVDAKAVRRHLIALRASGMGTRTIVQASGVGRTTVQTILYSSGTPGTDSYRPPRKRVTKQVAAAILAVKPQLAPGALVDGIGTRRRLQALVAVGWSQTQLAKRLGWTPSNFGVLIHGSGGVLESTRQLVADLYEQLWDQPPAARSISYARRVAVEHGWATPMAWDDDAIDDPRARPEGVLRPGEQPRRSAGEEIAWLAGQGYTDQDIASILGVQLDSIRRHRIHERKAS